MAESDVQQEDVFDRRRGARRSAAERVSRRRKMMQSKLTGSVTSCDEYNFFGPERDYGGSQIDAERDDGSCELEVEHDDGFDETSEE